MPNRRLMVPEVGAPAVDEPCRGTVWFDMTTGSCFECNETTHVYNLTPISRAMLTDITQDNIEWKRVFMPEVVTTDATEVLLYDYGTVLEGNVIYYEAVIEVKESGVAGSSGMVLEGRLERPVGGALYLIAQDDLRSKGLPLNVASAETLITGNTFGIQIKGRAGRTLSWAGRTEFHRKF